MSYKLYYAPAVCSLAPHIALVEGGFDYTLERVDLKTKKTEHGADYLQIAEKGAVPALQFPDGTLLTEGVAIMQYLADQKPESGLAPANGTLARARLQEWLNYITSELHKGHFPLFNADKAGDQAKALYLAKLQKNYDWLNGKLASQPYLMGDTFSLADAYLFTVLGWGKWVGVDIAAWPNLVTYQARIASRPSVQRAMAAEGLTQKQAA